MDIIRLVCHPKIMTEKRMILLSLAVEQSSEGIAVSDLEYLNSTFAEMHGYTVNEIVGKNLSIFHTPEQMQEVETANEYRQIEFS